MKQVPFESASGLRKTRLTASDAYDVYHATPIHLCAIAQRKAGIPDNPAMAHGRAMEPEAIREYEYRTGNRVSEVGFVYDGAIGATPDGRIDEVTLLEVKCPFYILDLKDKEEMPQRHFMQCQWQMMVTGAKYVHYVQYIPEDYIRKKQYRMRVVERDSDIIDLLRQNARFVWPLLYWEMLPKHRKRKRRRKPVLSYV